MKAVPALPQPDSFDRLTVWDIPTDLRTIDEIHCVVDQAQPLVYFHSWPTELWKWNAETEARYTSYPY